MKLEQYMNIPSNKWKAQVHEDMLPQINRKNLNKKLMSYSCVKQLPPDSYLEN